MIPKCSTGHVGIEDSADGSVMLKSTLSGIMVALGDTGRLASRLKYNLTPVWNDHHLSKVIWCSACSQVLRYSSLAALMWWLGEDVAALLRLSTFALTAGILVTDSALSLATLEFLLGCNNEDFKFRCAAFIAQLVVVDY